MATFACGQFRLLTPPLPAPAVPFAPAASFLPLCWGWAEEKGRPLSRDGWKLLIGKPMEEPQTGRGVPAGMELVYGRSSRPGSTGHRELEGPTSELGEGGELYLHFH